MQIEINSFDLNIYSRGNKQTQYASEIWENYIKPGKKFGNS